VLKVVPLAGGDATALVTRVSAARWMGSRHLLSERRGSPAAYSFQDGVYLSEAP
jgi:hypothetical protein